MRGFTLFEIIIVLGIISALTLGAVFLTPQFRKSVDLDGQSEAVIETLNNAQSNARSRLNQSAWGVHLESGRYVSFKGSSYNPADPMNQIFYVAAGLQISAVNLNGGGSDVVFEEFSGETSGYGSFRVGLASDASKYREIRVDYSGRAAVLGSSLPPQDTRVYDSRHAHYQLGWTIKNSTKIIFNFPRVSQNQEVAMAGYFNGDKSDFDWSGSFTVASVTQEFRVHTHSLTGSDTLLSVTRDRSGGKNNEEVRIYIDYDGVNREIAHYQSDGSVTAGDYGGLMTIQ